MTLGLGSRASSSSWAARGARHLRDPLYRHSYFLMAGAGLNAVAGFAFWVIAARFTTVDSIGRAAALISAVSLLTYLTGLGLPYGILRLLGTATTELSALIDVSLLLSALGSVVAAVVFVLGAHLWAANLVPDLDSAGKLLLFVVFNVVVALGLLLDAVFVSRRRAQWALLRSFIGAAGRLVALAVIPLTALGLYAATFIPIALTTGGLLIVLPALISSYRRKRSRLTREVRELLSFSFQSYPSILFAGAPAFILPLVVLSLLGARATGYFFIAWNYAVILQLLPSTISQVSLSEGARSEPWAVAARAKRFALGTTFPIVALIWFAAGPLLSVYGAKYVAHSAFALRSFAFATLPLSFLTINFSALRATGRTWEVIVWSGFMACTVLTAAIALGSVLGLHGVVIGWAAGLISASFLVEMRTRRLRGRQSCLPAVSAPRQEPFESEHRFVFVGGVHRSGTTPLTRWLTQHPLASGFSETGVPEDEGQHLQSVYPPEQLHGGPGRFGFQPAAHLTEGSSLITDANRHRLYTEWSRHWDVTKPVLVEKSPPNVIQTRFLQEMFPQSAFVIVIRHPIAVAAATRKWAHPLLRWAKMPRFIEHWLCCYERFLEDAVSLERVLLIRYEDLVQRPSEQLRRVFEMVGVPALPIDAHVINGRNREYAQQWQTMPLASKPGVEWAVRRYEERVRRFGYSLRDPEEICAAAVDVEALLRGGRAFASLAA
jgi:O-antigen/teichoic acid export membrane protein